MTTIVSARRSHTCRQHVVDVEKYSCQAIFAFRDTQEYKRVALSSRGTREFVAFAFHISPAFTFLQKARSRLRFRDLPDFRCRERDFHRGIRLGSILEMRERKHLARSRPGFINQEPMLRAENFLCLQCRLTFARRPSRDSRV